MIPLHHVNMPPPEELMPALRETLYSGWVGQGPKVAAFESAFSSWLGPHTAPGPNVVATNSGTSALQLALRLADVRGGEVISTPMTCAATNLAILAEDADVAWADVDPRSGNIEPESVEKKISKHTRAIMCVHWGGLPCDLGALREVADRHGLPLIEDAAHALGARYGDRTVGNGTADFSVFSFQAIKHMTTVDGGMLTVRDPDELERARRLRWYGLDRGRPAWQQDITEPGLKWHMNDVAATIGLVALPLLQSTVWVHRSVAAAYQERLGERYTFCADTATCRKLGARSSHWLATILLPKAGMREAFTAHMASRGVAVGPVHRRNDGLTCFRSAGAFQLPGLDEFASRMVCLPCHAGLTPEHAGQIVRATEEF